MMRIGRDVIFTMAFQGNAFSETPLYYSQRRYLCLIGRWAVSPWDLTLWQIRSTRGVAESKMAVESIEFICT